VNERVNHHQKTGRRHHARHYARQGCQPAKPLLGACIQAAANPGSQQSDATTRRKQRDAQVAGRSWPLTRRAARLQRLPNVTLGVRTLALARGPDGFSGSEESMAIQPIW